MTAGYEDVLLMERICLLLLRFCDMKNYGRLG